MKVQKANPCYKPEIGDVLWNSRIFLEQVNQDLLFGDHWKVLPFYAVSMLPYKSLEFLGIDGKELENGCKYECPYTGYNHFGIVPIVLLYKDLSVYDLSQTRLGENYAKDSDWHRKHEEWDCLTSISKSFLGPGYTHGTTILDGSGSIRKTTVGLDNGDRLLVHFWEWYNK